MYVVGHGNHVDAFFYSWKAEVEEELAINQQMQRCLAARKWSRHQQRYWNTQHQILLKKELTVSAWLSRIIGWIFKIFLGKTATSICPPACLSLADKFSDLKECLNFPICDFFCNCRVPVFTPLCFLLTHSCYLLNPNEVLQKILITLYEIYIGVHQGSSMFSY